MKRRDIAASRVAGHREAATALMWLYVMGERQGRDIKIGVTKKAHIADRRAGIDREQMNGDQYVLLVGVRAPAFTERRIHEYFARYQRAKGSHVEYFEPAEEIIEWILWLRQQWWAVHDENVHADKAPEEVPAAWLPDARRREPRPPIDETRLIQDEQAFGPLAGTAWRWMPDLTATFQDYFTPEDIVRRASWAMGGIDLDAASHWIANARLHEAGVEIPEYFHVGKSAMTNLWHGRVWLNPPYGENERWFLRAEEMLELGAVEQLCWLSPAYAFITKIADSMVRRSAAAVLLSPTPEFFNPGDRTKKGTNLPHMIFYWGNRVDQFLDAFDEDGVGIAVTLGKRLAVVP